MAGRGLVPIANANTQRRTIAMPACHYGDQPEPQSAGPDHADGSRAWDGGGSSHRMGIRGRITTWDVSCPEGLKAGCGLYRFARTPEVRILLFPEEK